MGFYQQIEVLTTNFSSYIAGQKRKLIDRLNDEVKGKKAELEELDEELVRQRKHVKHTCSRVKALLEVDHILGELTAEDSNLEARLDKLENESSLLERKVDDLEEELGEVTTSIENQLSELSGELQNVKSVLDSMF